MYLINKEQNSISKLEAKLFTELGFRERQHLQEWIANEPSSLGEDLLIIQKEFDGFKDTRERLDLLALDKNGSLVVIENKLDDSGKDVVWQAIKYASYCSSLKQSEVVDIYQDYLNKYHPNSNAKAIDNIIEFLDGKEWDDIALNKEDQRIIFVAANFRQEITSAVFWLLNHQIRLQCFKATPYQLGTQLFLSIEQIIPIKDAEDYMIGMAEKVKEDKNTEFKLQNRHKVRLQFWERLLDKIKESQCTIFDNVNPVKENWIWGGSGVRNVPFSLVFSKDYARVEVYINRTQNESKAFFDEVYKEKIQIEKEFGDELVWERMDDKKASRIKYEMSVVDGFDKSNWDEMINFMVDTSIKFEHVLKNRLNRISNSMK
jgi:hypothetical protein